MEDTVQTPKRTPYWLLAKNECTGVEVLITGLSNGRQALPVFSFKEEAEMFLCLKNSRDDWRVRETTPGELLSMLYTILKSIKYITLDPIPMNSAPDTSVLLSVARKDFIGRLERTNSRCLAAGKGRSNSRAFNEFGRTRRRG